MKKRMTIWGARSLAAALGAFTILAGTPLTAFGAGQTYTITYSPGRLGTFTEAYYSSLQSAYSQNGEVKITKSGKTGNIKIQLPAQSAYPAAPQPEDIELKAQYEGEYVIDPSWMPQEEVVTSSETYVVDYEALVEGVTYRVEFVDAESGNQVASPVIAQGNVDQVISYTAQRVENYQVTGDRSQSMTLSPKGENIITFQYTSTAEPIVTPGDTVTVEETVPGDTVTVVENQPAAGGAGAGTPTVTAGAGTGAGAGTAQAGAAGAAQAGNAGAAGAAGQTEVIEGEETPLGETPELDGQDEDAQGDTAEIEEEETPLAQDADLEDEKSQEEESSIASVAVGVLAVLVALGGVVFYIWKRRK